MLRLRSHRQCAIRLRQPTVIRFIEEIHRGRIGTAIAGQHRHRTTQQILQTVRFNFDMEKLSMRGRFGLPHVEIRVIQRQHDAEMNLFTRPNVSGRRSTQGLFQQMIVFRQRLHHQARMQVQLRQTAAVVFHLFQEREQRSFARRLHELQRCP